MKWSPHGHHFIHHNLENGMKHLKHLTLTFKNSFIKPVKIKSHKTKKQSPHLASVQTCRPIHRESPCPISLCWARRGFPGRSPSSSPETWVLGWKHPNPTGPHRTELVSLNRPISLVQNSTSNINLSLWALHTKLHNYHPLTINNSKMWAI